ncbi:MAG TPA: IclR family transcriptional regulator C-terminal domain-containing protein, partial [Quisquiliibacterium sp.]|nr:IclR family transcriptional regulator C-terminal domain-containing protein [Quisquiliibacterium sp.]
GSRRPLGIGAGSLALLAFLPDAEIASLMPLIAERFDRYPRYSERFLTQQIEQSRRRGYAVLYDVVVDRMGGIGVPIMGDDGRPAAALSIAALSDRISSREQAMADALRQEAALCTQNWQRPVTGREPAANGQDD